MRTYGAGKSQSTRTQSKPPIAPPPDAVWDDWENAAIKLQQIFDKRGFSVASLRKRKSQWTKGVHWIKAGGVIKLNVAAIAEWVRANNQV